MSDYEYEFTHLTVEQRKQSLDSRIVEYESRIWDNIMNAKAEAISKNPHRERAIRMLHDQCDELKTAIEMCRYELSMLDLPVAEGEPTHEGAEA